MKDPIEPSEANKIIAKEAESNAELYKSLYDQYKASIEKGGHGSCCEMQTCYRARHEESLLEAMQMRLYPLYYRH